MRKMKLLIRYSALLICVAIIFTVSILTSRRDNTDDFNRFHKKLGRARFRPLQDQLEDSDTGEVELQPDDVLKKKNEVKPGQQSKFMDRYNESALYKLLQSAEPDIVTTDPLENDSFVAQPSYLVMHMKRIVHIDFKGGPLKLSYLKQLFRHLTKWGATGILLEYEDMFPFEREMKTIPARNAYTKDELRQLLQFAKDQRLEVIPLVNVFTEMDYVLKHKDYEHFRENKNETYGINPIVGINFAKEMIKQVVNFHSEVVSLSHVHLGGSRHESLGTSYQSKLYLERGQKTENDLILQFITGVTAPLKASNIKPIVWQDLTRGVDLASIVNNDLVKQFEPMIRHDFNNKGILTSDMVAASTISGYFWLAPLYKCAGKGTDYLTNLQLHLSLYTFLFDIMSENQLLIPRIRGIALLGPQRSAHFNVLCEPLPEAIPSLVTGLRIFTQGSLYGIPVSELVSKTLHCHPFNKTEQDFRGEACKFPGSPVYQLLPKIKEVYKAMRAFNSNPVRQIIGNECPIFYDSQNMLQIFVNYPSVKRGLEDILINLPKALSRVYNFTSVAEFMLEQVYPRIMVSSTDNGYVHAKSLLRSHNAAHKYLLC